MKILILCNKMPYPLKDGGAIATYRIAEGLSQQKNSIAILAMNTSKHFTNVAVVQKAMKTIASISAIYLSTKLNPIKALFNLFFSKYPYNVTRFWSKKYKNELIKIIKSENFDIIQIESIYLGIYIPIIKKTTGASIVLRPHNLEYEIWESLALNTKYPIRRIYLKILAKRIKNFELGIINQYDLIVPISEVDAFKFSAIGNIKPMYIMPVGINISVKQFITVDSPISLFYIGALDWLPNLESLNWFLDEIWPVVKMKHSEIKLYVAGRNAPDWIERKCKEKSINFLGEVEDSSGFMENKTVMIVPLKSGSGIRVKIIEAMSKGKVVISTSIGVQGINGKHGEHIMIADSTSQFVLTIEQLINDVPLVNKIGQNALIYVNDHFDNSKLCASLNEFYIKYLK